MANIKIRPAFYGPGKEKLNHFKKWSIHSINMIDNWAILIKFKNLNFPE